MKRKRKKKRIFLVCTLICAAAVGGAVTVENIRENAVVLKSPSTLYHAEAGDGENVYYESESDIGRSLPTDEEISAVSLPFATELFCQYLTEKELTVCKQIYYGISNFETEINITGGVVSREDICSFIAMCTSSAPELDYISPEYTVVLDSDGYVTAVKFEYSKTAEQVQADNEAVEQAAESILSGLDDSMSDYDKVKAIHDAVIKGCTYDESDSECYTALGCLEKGKAVCEGYAKAMMLLCGKVGIGCIPVVGSGIEDGNELPHIWNKVLIDGEWYNFDLTWDDPVSSLGDDYVRYDYFAVTDEEIGTDHITEENKYVTYPVADTDGGDYFSVNGLYITDISEAEAVVRSSVERAMADDEIYARFKCADSETYNAVVDEIFNNEYDGGTKIFGILREACERYSEKSYSSTGYSIIKNEQMNTVTVKLNRL